MNTASLKELKEELKHRKPAELVELCARLARFKKENKELLGYLLFEADDERQYIVNVKASIDEGFSGISKDAGFYIIKKMVRKVLRLTNKYIRYSGKNTTAVELLLHFCEVFRNSGISIGKSLQLQKIYEAQLAKIARTINDLHEDLRFDYGRKWEELTQLPH